MKFKYQDKVKVKDDFFGDFEGELIDYGQRPKDPASPAEMMNPSSLDLVDMYLVQFERGATQRWFEADKLEKVESK